MEGGLFLDVVIRESATVLELLAGEDESLLIGRDAFLVLDLGLDGLDGVSALHLEGDGLTREGFDEDLHDLASGRVRLGRCRVWGDGGGLRHGRGSVTVGLHGRVGFVEGVGRGVRSGG